jgi:hypothetical protein
VDVDPDTPFRRTLDSLLESFQIVSREGVYLYVNPAPTSSWVDACGTAAQGSGSCARTSGSGRDLRVIGRKLPPGTRELGVIGEVVARLAS